MANVKSNRKKLIKIVSVIIVVIALVLGTDFTLAPNGNHQSGSSTYSEGTLGPMAEGELKLHMIDVGQADSFLFVQNGKTALIDCGTRETGTNVVKYLKQLGINRIDYLFGTHPHDDHMGGMYEVISNFEIGTIILPKVKSGEVTTNWYLKLMAKIKNDKYNVKYADVGEIYKLGDATMKVIGPISAPEEGELNNYSTVLKVTFGKMDVIMTGDAETQVEKQILESGEYIDAEILKVGHHGSKTSTSKEFLEAVNPDYALISAGVDNRYHHPVKDIMELLKSKNVIVYRTDESGTVVATITAETVTFNCNPGDYLSGTELAERSGKQ